MPFCASLSRCLINLIKLYAFCVHTALYSIILFCVFIWIPFVYFYYEERDDDNMNKCLVSMCPTFFFLLRSYALMNLRYFISEVLWSTWEKLILLGFHIISSENKCIKKRSHMNVSDDCIMNHYWVSLHDRLNGWELLYFFHIHLIKWGLWL